MARYAPLLPPLLSIIIGRETSSLGYAGIGTDKSGLMVSMGNPIGDTMVMAYPLATPVCMFYHSTHMPFYLFVGVRSLFVAYS